MTGRRLLGALLAAVLAASGALLPAVAARADSTRRAQADADRLLAQVQRLQGQVETATADYQAALSTVGQAVTRSMFAREALQQAQRASDDRRQQLDARIRGLYMSGGPLALYAGVLDATGVDDLVSRMVMARGVVHVDAVSLDATRLVLDAARLNAAAAKDAATRTIVTERTVTATYAHLADLLAREQAALDEARARVSNLQALDAARARLSAERAAAAQVTVGAVAGLQPLPASAEYLALYHRAAATCPGLSWQVLAAIGQVESGHGRDPSTSSAGAMGPMQFLPATFAAYGVDGNGDGVLDIMNPADAIFSAAHYLCADGAGQGGAALYGAIWNYNHADWYVQMVLALAARYA